MIDKLAVGKIARLIIRDATGKYVWDCNLIYDVRDSKDKELKETKDSKDSKDTKIKSPDSSPSPKLSTASSKQAVTALEKSDSTRLLFFSLAQNM